MFSPLSSAVIYLIFKIKCYKLFLSSPSRLPVKILGKVCLKLLSDNGVILLYLTTHMTLKLKIFNRKQTITHVTDSISDCPIVTMSQHVAGSFSLQQASVRFSLFEKRRVLLSERTVPINLLKPSANYMYRLL